MRQVLFIVCLFYSLASFGQGAKSNEKKLKKDRVGFFAQGVYSVLDGLQGNERRKEIRDYTNNLNAAGFKASGGVLPRYGFSAGAYYSRFFSKRYAVHMDLGFIQNGYRERIFVEGADSSTTLTRDYKLNVDLNYIHLFSGVRYYHDSGISLMLGFYMNYNIYDKVNYKEDYSLTDRNGVETLNESKEVFFHEYFNENRQIFLMGLGFGAGYRWKQFEFDATIKNSSSVAFDDEVLDMKFIFVQAGLRYRINKISDTE